MKRRILIHPENEKILRTPAAPITRIDKKVKALVRDLKDTLLDEAGVGLAAPQIGVSKRVFVIRLGQTHDGDPDEELSPPIAVINPELVFESETEERDYDACLSIPGLYGYTWRNEKIKLKALDENGDPIELELEGLDARAALHELDHLDGILFLDRIRDQDDLFVIRRDKEGNRVLVPIKNVLNTSI
jgi:peptide deformylase